MLIGAEDLINNGDNKNAQAILLKILELDPKNTDAYNNLSVINLYENNIAQAVEYLLNVAMISPSDEVMLSNFNYLKEQLNNDELDNLVLSVIQQMVYKSGADEPEESVKKVTIVQTSRWNINQPALAVAVLTGNLRSKNFTVYPFDFDVDFYNAVSVEDKKYWDDENDGFWVNDNDVKNLIEKYYPFKYACLLQMLINKPDVVGFSVQTKSRFLSIYYSEMIKKINKNIYVALGGPETSRGSNIMLKPYEYIDAIFVGEADISFPAFLSSLNLKTKEVGNITGVIYRDNNRNIVDCGPAEELPRAADIPISDFSDIDFSKYRVPNSVNLIMSRGCINKCSFCNESPIFKRYRSYKAQRAYDEIVNVLNTTNIGKNPRICFNDSLINGHLKDLEDFCDLLIENPIPGLTFSGMMLVRSKMSELLIKKLAKVGLIEVFLGVETGSEVVLKIMQKHFELPDVERLVKQMSENGIRVSVFFMVGHPGETELEFYNSLNFMRKLANHASQFSVNITQILENSDINLHPERYNVTDTNSMNWVADSGTNTYEVRRQRQLFARTLLGNKAFGMGVFFDPMDEESKNHYSQGRILYEEYTKLKDLQENQKVKIAQLEHQVAAVIQYVNEHNSQLKNQAV